MPVPVYGVVELGTVIPVVVIDGLAVVVDTACVVTLGIMVVVLDVDMPVMLLNAGALNTENGQNVGSIIGFDCGPQNSVPVATPLLSNVISCMQSIIEQLFTYLSNRI